MASKLFSRLLQRPSLSVGIAQSVVRREQCFLRSLSTPQLNKASGSLTLENKTYHPTWLRHNCHCPDCWSTISEQRSFDLDEIDPKNIVKSAKVTDGKLELEWSSGHHGYINMDWLNGREKANEDHSTPLIASKVPIMNGSDLLVNKEKRWEWWYNVNEYGICLLTDMGTDKDTILELARTMYHVQPTVYGETFHVIASDKFTNVAYSDKRLNFHMDNQHYEAPPGFELLHCVQFDECVEGGKSIMLDMFGIAEALREKHPEYFDTLSRVPATFERVHYERDEPVDMTVQVPHIQVDNDKKVIGLRWTPASEGTLNVPDEDVGPYFEAYHCLNKLFNESDKKLYHRLRAGQIMTFNNRRFVHSRTNFKRNGGERYLLGTYSDIDHFKSAYQVLTTQLGKDVHVRRVFNNNPR